MLFAALVKMLPVAPVAKNVGATVAGASCYDQLVRRVFRPDQAERQTRPLIAFASASKRAGTSFVTRAVGLELACYETESAAVIDAHRLQTISKRDLEKWARLCTAAGSKLSILEKEDVPEKPLVPASRKKGLSWKGSSDHRKECLQVLQQHFTSILIDCHSVGDCSGALSSVAALVDGIVLVTEAGQTRRDEVRRAERLIELAQGKVLGLVLNKRRYFVPEWLYRRI